MIKYSAIAIIRLPKNSSRVLFFIDEDSLAPSRAAGMTLMHSTKASLKSTCPSIT